MEPAAAPASENANAEGPPLKKKRTKRLLPCLDLSLDQRVQFAETCEKTGKSLVRFEKYRVAQTIGEARRLGATSVDIRYDHHKGLLKEIPEPDAESGQDAVADAPVVWQDGEETEVWGFPDDQNEHKESHVQSLECLLPLASQSDKHPAKNLSAGPKPIVQFDPPRPTQADCSEPRPTQADCGVQADAPRPTQADCGVQADVPKPIQDCGVQADVPKPTADCGVQADVPKPTQDQGVQTEKSVMSVELANLTHETYYLSECLRRAGVKYDRLGFLKR